jgi:hypothetical protein
MEEKDHILEVLRNVQGALEKRDYFRIKEMSNQVIHNASINQDPDVISVAVIIYSISKFIERSDYKEERNWGKFYNIYLKSIKNMIRSLESNDDCGFRKEVSLNRRLIQKISGKLKGYMEQVFRKAQINKASRIYEHGISMEKTAKILGISLWELADYAGKTGIGDINLSVTMPVQKRIKIAEEMFKK